MIKNITVFKKLGKKKINQNLKPLNGLMYNYLGKFFKKVYS